MGGSQSQGEREVTVEERDGEDGQPQIIVTQDFLHYVQERQQEEEGTEKDTSRDPNEAPPPYPEDEVPHVTAEDLVTQAQGSLLRGGGGRGPQDREEARLWQRRYQQERSKNSELKMASENEFAKTVAEVKEKFTEASIHDMLPVCDDCKDRVLKCYHSNPGKPLLCSHEVEEFVSCVEKARKSLIQPAQ